MKSLIEKQYIRERQFHYKCIDTFGAKHRFTQDSARRADKLWNRLMVQEGRVKR